jgi:hypothetical protein
MSCKNVIEIPFFLKPRLQPGFFLFPSKLLLVQHCAFNHQQGPMPLRAVLAVQEKRGVSATGDRFSERSGGLLL